MKVLQRSSYEVLLCDKFSILYTIENAARTCYQSWDRSDQTFQGACDFVRRLIASKHDPMLEFGDIIVRFTCDRGLSHELVRHRLCSFAQESTRYCDYKNEMEFISPFDDEASEDYLDWLNSMHHVEQTYRRMRSRGVSPQIARSVLPSCLKTELVVKANVREWRHILQLRSEPGAHPQMRALMGSLAVVLNEDYIPVVFEDIAASVKREDEDHE